MINVRSFVQTRPSLPALLGLTAVSAVAILLMWSGILSFGGLSGFGQVLFWIFHALLIATMISAVAMYGRRGFWSLLGFTAFLPAPLLIGSLLYACGAKDLCV